MLSESLNDVLPLVDELSESDVLVEILLLSEVEVLVLTESLSDVLPLVDELSESDVLVESLVEALSLNEVESLVL
ncbi:Asp-tRNA(Asn)/Glu-tRNA(Gln) amidotransferase C subunit [Staphylococcus warneri]